MRAREHRCAASMTISSSIQYAGRDEGEVRDRMLAFLDAVVVVNAAQPGLAVDEAHDRYSEPLTSGGAELPVDLPPQRRASPLKPRVVRQTGRCHGPQEARSEVAGHGLGFSRPVSGRVPLMFPAGNRKGRGGKSTTASELYDLRPVAGLGAGFTWRTLFTPGEHMARGVSTRSEMPLIRIFTCLSGCRSRARRTSSGHSMHTIWFSSETTCQRPTGGRSVPAAKKPEEHSPHQPVSTVDEDRQHCPAVLRAIAKLEKRVDDSGDAAEPGVAPDDRLPRSARSLARR